MKRNICKRKEREKVLIEPGTKMDRVKDQRDAQKSGRPHGLSSRVGVIS